MSELVSLLATFFSGVAIGVSIANLIWVREFGQLFSEGKTNE